MLVAIVLGVITGVLVIVAAVWISIKRRRKSLRQINSLQPKRESMSGLRRLHEVDGHTRIPIQSEIESHTFYERCGSFNEKYLIPQKTAELP